MTAANHGNLMQSDAIRCKLSPCRTWRDAMGFTNQAQAAKALGYSLAMVKKWEAEPVKHPVPFSILLAMRALYDRRGPWTGP